MKFAESIIEAIGNTPLVRLNRLPKQRGVETTILCKLEYMNPGGSVKDRIGVSMLEWGEREGKIKPGGTIVECTSGNTGVGLALAALAKGYRCIFVMPDKMSREKIDVLRGYGAEVIVTPTAVAPEDPRSYYSVARRLAQEIPNAWNPNQYDNVANPKAHYETTGPEIWRDTDGKIDAFVCGIGTCGTITGVGRFLREKNKNVKLVGVDPKGSIFYDTFHYNKVVSQPKTYLIEGIGEDFFPKNWDKSMLSDVVQVVDKDAYIMQRKLARQEGIFTGSSGGAAVWGAIEYCKKEKLGPEHIVVTLIPDSGQRYLSKGFSEVWLKENGIVDASFEVSAHELVAKKQDGLPMMVAVEPESLAFEALQAMKRFGIGQIPVVKNGKSEGSVREDQFVDIFVKHRDPMNVRVKDIMVAPFPEVGPDASLEDISKLLTRENPAVIVRDPSGELGIITKHDLIAQIAR
ncbi:pyridoxal-phosphate dependent enzyme [bacterium]|nr:pyridoxal-phosphate dependent enzyme [bacterium]